MEAEEAEDEEDGMIEIYLLFLRVKNTFFVWWHCIAEIYTFNIVFSLE